MAIYWFWFHYPTCTNVQRLHCTVHESAWGASLPVRTLKITISFSLTLISFHKNKFSLKEKKQEETTSAFSMTLGKTSRSTIRLNWNYLESVKTSSQHSQKLTLTLQNLKKNQAYSAHLDATRKTRQTSRWIREIRQNSLKWKDWC